MRSLRAQLPLTIMFIVLFTVAIITVLSNQIINREFESYISDQQKQKAEDIVTNVSSQYNSLTGEWNIEFVHGVGMYALYDGYIVKLYDRSGDMVWDAENHDMALCAQIMREILEKMEMSRPNNGGEFITHEHDLTQNGQKIGVLTISYYGPYFLSESDFRFINVLNSVFLFIGILSLLVALIVGHFFSRRITRPIIKTAEIAKQISGGNYAIRFEGTAKTKELNDLIIAINHLAGALSEQEDLRKQLTTDIAHELRTPLSTVGSHLEALIEGIWEPTPARLQSCYEEIDRLTELVADLERLTHIESDNPSLNKSSVDLFDVARIVSGNFAIEMKKKKLAFALVGDAVFVLADKDRLSQVITNLISNAIKYTHINGYIKITVKDSEKNGILVVEDNGIGIPENELPLIFERFYRTDKSRNRKTGGAGIGLAIVKSIVTAHDGTIMAESEVDQGSRFTVALPKYGARER